MTHEIILASGSEIRRKLLTGAGVVHRVVVAGVDETAKRRSMVNDGHSPHDIARALAAAKAGKVSQQYPGALTIGCDQVLEIDGDILGKPENPDDALAQLHRLNAKQHHLYSAVVVWQNGQPQWRFVGEVTLHMRQSSDAYLAGYVRRNWQSIRHSVGCYKLEEEGARLFSRIQGDYFVVLGLPLIELLGYLAEKGVLPK